jgi:hypothetical protein
VRGVTNVTRGVEQGQDLGGGQQGGEARVAGEFVRQGIGLAALHG